MGLSSPSSQSVNLSPVNSSPEYLPTLPIRTDSLWSNIEEEALLKSAPWFQAGIPREISLEILQQEPVGSFLVRHSTSKPGCYALSLRVPKDYQATAIAHYLIIQTNRGFKIKVNKSKSIACRMYHGRIAEIASSTYPYPLSIDIRVAYEPLLANIGYLLHRLEPFN